MFFPRVVSFLLGAIRVLTLFLPFIVFFCKLLNRFLGDIEFQYPTAATYMRNTGSFAVALCACYNAVCDPDSGLAVKSSYLPAKAQIEAMAKAVAVLCEAFDLSPARWEVMTHAEAADNLDGWDRGKNYGPLSTGEKWDLWKLADYDGEVKDGGDVLRGKANLYRENGAW